VRSGRNIYLLTYLDRGALCALLCAPRPAGYGPFVKTRGG